MGTDNVANAQRNEGYRKLIPAIYDLDWTMLQEFDEGKNKKVTPVARDDSFKKESSITVSRPA